MRRQSISARYAGWHGQASTLGHGTHRLVDHMNLEILSPKSAPIPQASQTDALRLDPSSLPEASFDGLYVHVPFCFHKCHYCAFYSITRQSAERMRRYVDLVLSEARSWANRPPKIAAKTVFFGGGTPSL